MKRKWIILILMVFSFLFLAGWGQKKVELLNDKKLIDLDAAIERCIPGADAPEEDNNNSTDGQNTEYVISVRNRQVTYKNEKYINMDRLKDSIKQDNGKGVSFKLVDDFAEAHVYKKVMAILSELRKEVGLKYTND